MGESGDFTKGTLEIHILFVPLSPAGGKSWLVNHYPGGYCGPGEQAHNNQSGGFKSLPKSGWFGFFPECIVGDQHQRKEKIPRCKIIALVIFKKNGDENKLILNQIGRCGC